MKLIVLRVAVILLVIVINIQKRNIKKDLDQDLKESIGVDLVREERGDLNLDLAQEEDIERGEIVVIGEDQDLEEAENHQMNLKKKRDHKRGVILNI